MNASDSPTQQSRFPQWLADAPLFIDADRIDQLYDAIVRPPTKEIGSTYSFSQKEIENLRTKLGVSAEISPSTLLSLIVPVFSLIKPTVKLQADQEKNHGTERESGITVEAHPISTPQRQLEWLTLHYLAKQPARIFFVSNPGEPSWRTPDLISSVPRALLFLDLPGAATASKVSGTPTMIIPTAAEFENGKTILIYERLRFDERVGPPRYPERADSEAELAKARRKYWNWFRRRFSSTKAIVAIEDAAAENGRIRWIDFRLPLTDAGDSLHLHMCPAGNFDTGVFAYNLVKRGYKHGLRLVGTLKSEPDLNVLAVYDK